MSLRPDVTMEAPGSMDEDEESPQPGQRAKAAAQACETCRFRKVKCDEDRPRCGVCQRLGTQCEYREPKPTKKDKTLVWIQDKIVAIENKVDQLLSSPLPGAPVTSSYHPQTSKPRTGVRASQLPASTGGSQFTQKDSSYNSMSSSSGSGPVHGANIGWSSNLSGPAPSAPGTGDSTLQTQSQSPAHIEARRILTWPIIRQLLSAHGVGPDLLDSQQQPPEKWLTDITRGFEVDLDVGAPVKFYNAVHSGSHQWSTDTMVISVGMIEHYTHMFFSSYHNLYPILDHEYFRGHTIQSASNRKFDPFDQQATLLLIVMALGDVAERGIVDEPILDESTNQPTGIRGGSRSRPPGLAFIGEARGRMGRGMTTMDITLVHCYILAALYYAQVSQNKEYWIMTVYASNACSILVKCVDDWNTFEGDTIVRAYWMCVLLEGGLMTELGLPPSALNILAIPMPQFVRSAQYPGDPAKKEKDLIIQCTFGAQITLRTELNRINESVRPFDGTPDGFLQNSPSYLVTKAHLVSLETWHKALPPEISWPKDEIPKRSAHAPHNVGRGAKSQYPPLTSTPDPDTDRAYMDEVRAIWSFETLHPSMHKMTEHFENINFVMQAALRTRYKYAHFLARRPYLYKVLHSSPHFTGTSPAEETQRRSQKAPASAGPGPPPGSQKIPINVQDVVYALGALQACTMWYLTHPVFKDQRRVLPHSYEYSHAIFGILLLFLAAEQDIVMTTAFAAAERGPMAADVGQPFPYASTGGSFGGGGPSAFSSAAGGGFGGGASGNLEGIRQSLMQMGAQGELEEYRFLREEMEISRRCFMVWLKDMQVVHPIAAWGWGTLKRVYGIGLA